MTYADFDYYANYYYGRSIQEEDFSRLALRASQYIDYITMGKAERSADLEAVKMCCCALAEQYQTIDTAQELSRKSLTAGASATSEVSSETVGSWSRSYRSGGESAQSAIQAVQAGQTSLRDIAMRYLAYTGLLYRGGRVCK